MKWTLVLLVVLVVVSSVHSRRKRKLLILMFCVNIWGFSNFPSMRKCFGTHYLAVVDILNSKRCPPTLNSLKVVLIHQRLYQEIFTSSVMTYFSLFFVVQITFSNGLSFVDSVRLLILYTHVMCMRHRIVLNV